MKILAAGVCAVLVAVLMHTQTVNAAASCESLSSLKLPTATITLAQTVPAGGFTASEAEPGEEPGGNFSKLPAFCRIAATLTPSSDSDIKIEVWLPASGWNGKLQVVGNGGWGGPIRFPALGEAVRRGYAASGTNTGHVGGGASWALGHPEKLADYAYRSQHEMTVKAKALTAAFYGAGPKLSYWNGCSAGGKDGLVAAQRYPEDFNGIIAGAPASDWTGRAAQSLRVWQAVHKDEASVIPPSKYPLIRNAVLEACDTLDGVKDGVLEDPTRCKFDPKVLACSEGEGPNCLTMPQVEAARAVYAAAASSQSKREVTGLYPGSELGWSTWAGKQGFGTSVEHFKYVVFKDPNWDFRTFNFDKDFPLADKVDNGLINALNPNLKPFFDRGGKLIQYHGWADPQISPGASVSYYKSVVNAMGGLAKVQASHRLFMVPGMRHCRGGDVPDTFDAVAALEQWVEGGKAPDQLIASRVTKNGQVDRTRPLCPYPQVAQYKGTGSPDEAANFVCKAL
jgi:feruloyl esterase